MATEIIPTTIDNMTANEVAKAAYDFEAGSPEETLARMRYVMMTQLDSQREQFVQMARWIARDLNAIADKVEADPKARPNSLGELQSNASNLNALCGGISALRSSLFGAMG